MQALAFMAIAAAGLYGCNKSSSVQPNATNSSVKSNAVSSLASSSCTYPYLITLESITEVNGNYEWVWAVKNTKPGNGSNGTVQDLSHWDITLGSCVKFSDVVSAATSIDGVNWTSFTPAYDKDKSLKSGLNNIYVVKFDIGTSGNATTFYKLVISKNVTVDMLSSSYYKSGNKTGTGAQCFPGFGCTGDGDEDRDSETRSLDK